MSNSTTDIVELCNVVEFYDFPNWTAIINRFAQKVARNNFSMQQSFDFVYVQLLIDSFTSLPQ